MGRLIKRYRWAIPYVLMAPGIAWLAVFFVVPNVRMLQMSLSEGSVERGFTFTWDVANYTDNVVRFGENFQNSVIFGGLATVFCFLVGYPLAYTIAFRGGRYKNLLLFLVISPFFTSFLIRTISWKIILGDDGPFLEIVRDILHLVPTNFSVLGSAVAVVAGLTYEFLPFMTLPLYVSLEKIDRSLIEAAHDLYASRWGAFRRVTLPLSLPGVFAGSLLVFIPAIGDYVNAELLGGPKTQMVGNVIQARFLAQNDYPTAAALAFILMAAILVGILAYARLLGTEQLTGGRA